MKISMSADEVDNFSAMSDEDLVKAVRDALKEFGAARGGKDDEPGTASKSGRSESTLETAASRSANQSAADRAAHRRAANNQNLTAADRAAHRLAANDYSDETARDKAVAKLIPGYDRL